MGLLFACRKPRPGVLDAKRSAKWKTGSSGDLRVPKRCVPMSLVLGTTVVQVTGATRKGG